MMSEARRKLPVCLPSSSGSARQICMLWSLQAAGSFIIPKGKVEFSNKDEP
jgi:hypothetical protein